VSHLEIYNEEVRDLLSRDAKARLELRESPERGVHVRGLLEFVVKSAAEMAAVLEVGARQGGLLGLCPCWALHWRQALPTLEANQPGSAEQPLCRPAAPAGGCLHALMRCALCSAGGAQESVCGGNTDESRVIALTLNLYNHY
jgi:hypothetical protein